VLTPAKPDWTKPVICKVALRSIEWRRSEYVCIWYLRNIQPVNMPGSVSTVFTSGPVITIQWCGGWPTEVFVPNHMSQYIPLLFYEWWTWINGIGYQRDGSEKGDRWSFSKQPSGGHPDFNKNKGSIYSSRSLMFELSLNGRRSLTRSWSNPLYFTLLTPNFFKSWNFSLTSRTLCLKKPNPIWGLLWVQLNDNGLMNCQRAARLSGINRPN